MPIEIEGERYYSAKEAAAYLSISRQTFYTNIQPHLTEYRYGAFKRIYYRKQELDRYRGIRPADQDER